MTRAVQSQPPAAGQRAPFRVSLIFLIKDKQRLDRIRPDDGGFELAARVPGRGDVLEFQAETVADERELGCRLATFRVQQRRGQFLVISDALTERRPDGGLGPSPLALSVREPFRAGPHLCGMVALAGPPAGRVSEIDVTLPADADRAAIVAAIVKAATGLWLKAPLPGTGATATEAGVRAEVVTSPDQLRACLALRKRVYEMLSYLPDRIAADPSGLEMDGYDIGAIHFAAMRGDEVVGTVRLVTELPVNVCAGNGLGREVVATCVKHREWTTKIARKSPPAVRNRAAARPFLPLPILQSSEFNDRWSDMLAQTSPGAELSRLVVAPAWRGFHISENLVRMVVAKAFQMGLKVLLLECIPTHVGMYARYGFKPLAGTPHSRPTDLDQYAVGMWLQFRESTRQAMDAEKLLAKIKMQLDPAYGPIDVGDAAASG